MASSTDESETAVLLDGPALYVDFQDQSRGGGGASAKIESKDVAPRRIGLVRRIVRLRRGPLGERQAGDRNAPGEVTILGVVLLSQEGCELARWRGTTSDSSMPSPGMRAKGLPSAFLEKVGAVCAAEKVVRFEWIGHRVLHHSFSFQ